ncbi:MAG: hypothetical protein Q7S59_07055 [Sulfurimonas sp.]|nr:hypothetical protein [Sulfurimonas sp.]
MRKVKMAAFTKDNFENVLKYISVVVLIVALFASYDYIKYKDKKDVNLLSPENKIVLASLQEDYSNTYNQIQILDNGLYSKWSSTGTNSEYFFTQKRYLDNDLKLIRIKIDALYDAAAYVGFTQQLFANFNSKIVNIDVHQIKEIKENEKI